MLTALSIPFPSQSVIACACYPPIALILSKKLFPSAWLFPAYPLSLQTNGTDYRKKRTEMKLKRYIAYLLLVVSMMMLAVPVIPHHHHTDGLLCMKNDLGRAGSEQPVQHPRHAEEHCCCHTGCITTHFFQQRSQMDTTWLHPAPDDLPSFLIAFPPRLFSSPDNATGRKHFTHYYIESLHSTFIARATALRAPPSPLS